MHSRKTIPFFLLFSVSVLVSIFLPVQAAVSEQCQKMNPQKVSDVQNCLASKSELAGMLTTSGAFSGCNVFKSMATRGLPLERRNNPPGCRVIAKALTNLNGQAPFWEGCIDHAEGKGNLKNCFGGLKQLMSSRGSNQGQSSCGNLQTFLSGYVGQLINDEQYKNYKVPDCKQIAAAWNDGTYSLAGMECTDFKRNSEAHISKCLKPELVKLKSNPGCAKLRTIYQQKLKLAYGKMPGNYQMPTCPMLDKVAQKFIVANVAAAEKPGSPTAPVVQRSTTRANPVQQPASVSTRRQQSAPASDSAASKTQQRTRSVPVEQVVETDKAKAKVASASDSAKQKKEKAKKKKKKSKDKLKEKKRKLKEKLKKLELKF